MADDTTTRDQAIARVPLKASDEGTLAIIPRYFEGAWRMAYVRGPEGIIVSLAERIG